MFTMSYFMGIILLVKGQIISKGLFDILEFFQKTNEQIGFSQSHYIEVAQGGVSSSAIHNHTQF